MLNQLFNACTSRTFWPCWSINLVMLTSTSICGAVKYHSKISEVTLFFFATIAASLVIIQLLWYTWAAFVDHYSQLVMESIRTANASKNNHDAFRNGCRWKIMQRSLKALKPFGIHVSDYCILNTQAVLGFLLIECNVVTNVMLIL